jgi:peptidase M42 family hydrolase
MTMMPRPRASHPDRPAIDVEYITGLLLELLAIPSPAGYTDEIVHRTGQELERLGIPFELTRRGAIRADVNGRVTSPDRAIVAHLDTLGAMVTTLKSDGRLGIASIGTWSSRFAEGARVKVLCESGCRTGTILPLKASGHAFDRQVDLQPTDWDHVEVRLDEVVQNDEDLRELGLRVGDFVAVEPNPERTPSGFINSRHLDDKAGVAVVLGAVKAVLESGRPVPLDCHLVFTISEEVGSGSSHTLHRDVAEMVTIDSAPQAPGQASIEFGVTVGMMDSTGPFDYHLTQKLIRLCEQYEIPFQRDVFRYYRSDSASAVEAGNDLRTALACFGVDASHGWERTHTHALQSLAELLALYVLSEPTFTRDAEELTSLDKFSRMPTDPGEPTHPEDVELPTDSKTS